MIVDAILFHILRVRGESRTTKTVIGTVPLPLYIVVDNKLYYLIKIFMRDTV